MNNGKRHFNGKMIEEIQEYLLDCMGDTEEEAIHEIKRYKQNFSRERGYNLYQYGNILPYYSDMRIFCEDTCGVKMNKDDTIMQETFEKYICKAVDDLLAMDKYKKM